MAHHDLGPNVIHTSALHVKPHWNAAKHVFLWINGCIFAKNCYLLLYLLYPVYHWTRRVKLFPGRYFPSCPPELQSSHRTRALWAELDQVCQCRWKSKCPHLRQETLWSKPKERISHQVNVRARTAWTHTQVLTLLSYRT